MNKQAKQAHWEQHIHKQNDHCLACGWCNVWFNCGCFLGKANNGKSREPRPS